ncbi:MAG: NHL repeat-containing protein [Planctomycetales bacterium]
MDSTLTNRLRTFLLACLGAALIAPSAPAAEMKYPLSVAAAGKTVFLADKDMHGVWKIDDGKLQVVFEGSPKFRTPLNAIRYVTLDSKGRLLAADSATRDIYRFDDNQQPVPLTKGEIGIPMAIACDAQGDIYVADLEIHRIVKVPEAGGMPTVVAELQAPRGLAFDSQGRLWGVSAVSAQSDKPQLVRIGADGKLETVVKGVFNLPHHVALDPAGNAYVADNYDVTIWKISPEGKAEKWVQGEPLKGPVGLCWQEDRLLVADPKATGTFLFSVNAEGKVTPVEFAK